MEAVISLKIDKDYWRCYKCIDCGNTYEHLDNKETFYEVGKTIGRFQKNLSNFPLHKLNQTIKDFHDTKKRYDKLKCSILISLEYFKLF